MDKKKVILPITAGIAALTIFGSEAFAYYSATVKTVEQTETQVKANKLGLRFEGVDEIVAINMIPGDSFKKTFSVQNISSHAVAFNIYMEAITNEFNEDLVYTLEDKNGVVVAESALPTTTGKSYLKQKINIASGATKTYTLTITYKYLEDVSQNDYQGKTFKATLDVDTEGASQVPTETKPISLAKCKRATSLHTEICNQSSHLCAGDGYSEGSTITYGNLGSGNDLSTGDAFDCDVNGDENYSERFYYVSDLEGKSDTAVLVYYSNVIAGNPDNMSLYAYHTLVDNYYGPQTAKLQLPTTDIWSNISLTNEIRDIKDENGKVRIQGFSYSGYAARLLTYDEIYRGCYNNITSIDSLNGLSSKCKFLVENTKYASNNVNSYGTWLETPYSASVNYAWYIHSFDNYVGRNDLSIANGFGVRPVIEVAKSDIELE